MEAKVVKPLLDYETTCRKARVRQLLKIPQLFTELMRCVGGAEVHQECRREGGDQAEVTGKSEDQRSGQQKKISILNVVCMGVCSM